METITWNDNKILMGKLWPRWAPSPEEASILNRKWGSLHQDKLRDCIEQHKLVRNSKPDISPSTRRIARSPQPPRRSLAARRWRPRAATPTPCKARPRRSTRNGMPGRWRC